MNRFSNFAKPGGGLRRPVLMVLQGPVGGYFGSLVHDAEAAGWRVLNVQFNLADRVFKHGGETIVFRAEPGQWGAWLQTLCETELPDCVVLFGDRRPCHIVACDVAARLDIPLYSFEEGYLRPDTITFERGGNNARSPLSRRSNAYGPAFGPEPKMRPVGATFKSMTLAAISYFVVMAAGRPAFRHYRHHRERTLKGEAGRWILNAVRKGVSYRRDMRTQDLLLSELPKRYYLVALQVHDDLQAVHHGAGWSQERLVETSILTFAAHAPADTALVLRCHPYDRGHREYQRLVTAAARRAGVADRVHLMQNGHGPSLLAQAAGMITVNSTMALSALYHDCPVYALGDSFYRIDGLVAPGEGETGLAAFFAEPGAVDAELYHAFTARLRRQALIGGSYYLRHTWPAMTRQVLRRLAADGIGAAAEQRDVRHQAAQAANVVGAQFGGDPASAAEVVAVARKAG